MILYYVWTWGTHGKLKLLSLVICFAHWLLFMSIYQYLKCFIVFIILRKMRGFVSIVTIFLVCKLWTKGLKILLLSFFYFQKHRNFLWSFFLASGWSQFVLVSTKYAMSMLYLCIILHISSKVLPVLGNFNSATFRKRIRIDSLFF